MASPELLQLVENCPTGAETLIARILNIITDKGNVDSRTNILTFSKRCSENIVNK